MIGHFKGRPCGQAINFERRMGRLMRTDSTRPHGLRVPLNSYHRGIRSFAEHDKRRRDHRESTVYK